MLLLIIDVISFPLMIVDRMEPADLLRLHPA
jgi:hypothetical protein